MSAKDTKGKKAAPAPRIEEKLYQNRYLVDAGRPHVKIKNQGEPTPELKTLVNVCPAGCYAITEQGKVEVVPDGCMECGTCRVLTAETGDLEWNYPRGGYGVAFKFG
ncbi:ferredoxin family protein [Rhodovastum atsumiense]|uniref:Ferredoxin-like protein n=1 Tax=Rhodovastum atsumiense TaxID=504468 RepID=A0A5M6IZ56_9PROT|nr:ferredoxin family protein [Rhodovastum atsumiense]KAA5613612.1 ferredoxin family protein [Rhodovastum atsumiense]